ncbi:hypothetical protein [Methanobacterium sp.]|uniref:hypothetical protein n=1 Tax=Methanobacterium sp. TaxID=2164 RepID=UPI002ABCAED3|nr:hypothetical protein [Methanobacterium sp.]MDY9923200.1 hypothetical protein [Methanobacterium sp.]
MGEDITTVAIVTRRLKEGKTYDDFRKEWYHTIGFGASNKMYTIVNTFDDGNNCYRVHRYGSGFRSHVGAAY